MALKNFIIILCLGAVWAQSEPSVSDAINNLPPELQGKVDEKQVTEIKEKSMQAFKKKCEENAGPDAYQKAENSVKGFGDCIKALVNPEVLQQEIEDAKPVGQVDEVFKKYCQKMPSFKSCFRNVTETMKPCFSLDEQKNLKTVNNISEQLAEFVCFKEGDRIALFIAENGPECIREKQTEIEVCVNSTMGGGLNFNKENMTIENIPKINFGDKECQQMADLQQCVVSSLETCSAPTSANIVESLFKFVRKATPCKDIPEAVVQKKEPHNSATSLMVKSVAMAATVLTLLV